MRWHSPLGRWRSSVENVHPARLLLARRGLQCWVCRCSVRDNLVKEVDEGPVWTESFCAYLFTLLHQPCAKTGNHFTCKTVVPANLWRKQRDYVNEFFRSLW